MPLPHRDPLRLEGTRGHHQEPPAAPRPPPPVLPDPLPPRVLPSRHSIGAGSAATQHRPLKPCRQVSAGGGGSPLAVTLQGSPGGAGHPSRSQLLQEQRMVSPETDSGFVGSEASRVSPLVRTPEHRPLGTGYGPGALRGDLGHGWGERGGGEQGNGVLGAVWGVGGMWGAVSMPCPSPGRQARWDHPPPSPRPSVLRSRRMRSRCPLRRSCWAPTHPPGTCPPGAALGGPACPPAPPRTAAPPSSGLRARAASWDPTVPAVSGQPPALPRAPHHRLHRLLPPPQLTATRRGGAGAAPAPAAPCPGGAPPRRPLPWLPATCWAPAWSASESGWEWEGGP